MLAMQLQLSSYWMSSTTGALDSFTNLHTSAREMPYCFATVVRLMPERRSRTTAGRSRSSRALPILRPSSFALRIPAFTRSIIRLRSH